ncbi:MAG: hypothetical protein ACRC33_03280 [Gemmataceae bacterium]
MSRWIQLAGAALALCGVLTLAGCGETPKPSGDKMGKDKMEGDKMGKDKMEGDKMGKDKMGKDK